MISATQSFASAFGTSSYHHYLRLAPEILAEILSRGRKKSSGLSFARSCSCCWLSLGPSASQRRSRETTSLVMKSLSSPSLSAMTSVQSRDNKCDVCSAPASQRCQQCKSSYYCSREHQLADWKKHKGRCKAIAADIARADSHSIHKREFDRIRVKYGLDSPKNAEKIADLLSNKAANEGVSAPQFAEMFDMRTEEAVVFLEWIKVGVKFKEEVLDSSKNFGLLG